MFGGPGHGVQRRDGSVFRLRFQSKPARNVRRDPADGVCVLFRAVLAVDWPADGKDKLAGIYGGVPAAVFLGACLAAVSYGFGTPIGASFVRKFFGERYYAINYSLINLVGLSASLCGPTVVGTLRTHTGSYVLPTAVLLLYSLLAVPALERLKEEKR